MKAQVREQIRYHAKHGSNQFILLLIPGVYTDKILVLTLTYNDIEVSVVSPEANDIGGRDCGEIEVSDEIIMLARSVLDNQALLNQHERALRRATGVV